MSKPARRTHETEKTIVKHSDDTWGLDVFNLMGYGIKNNRGHRYIPVLIKFYSNYGFGVTFKNIADQTMTKDFSNCIHESNRK